MAQQQSNRSQFSQFNWNESILLKPDKNISFTMSQLSKNSYYQHYEDKFDFEEVNKKLNQKLKNKINSKNFRQRKKNQQDKLQKKLKLLEDENYLLKKSKTCKYCKRPYQGLIQLNSNINQYQQTHHSHNNNHFDSQKQTKQTFEFQKFSHLHKNNIQKTQKNGKIWIALGILMLVIGVHLYGIRGEDGYQGISISKLQSTKWINTFQSKSSNLHNLNDYFNIKMKFKDQQSYQIKKEKNKLSKQSQIFQQIKIFHQEGQEIQTNKYQYNNNNIKSNMIDEESQIKFTQINLDYLNQDNLNQEVRFHKDFLWAIQAEIDDLGNYI